MQNFLKINGMCALYAIQFFIIVELMVNVYRLSRITGIQVGTMNNVVLTSVMLIAILFSWFMFKLTVKWMKPRKSSYLPVILWLPYLHFYMFVFANLFPLDSPGEVPGPGTGFVLIAMLLTYPVYIYLIKVIALNK
jgi:hypothetical protein